MIQDGLRSKISQSAEHEAKRAAARAADPAFYRKLAKAKKHTPLIR